VRETMKKAIGNKYTAMIDVIERTEYSAHFQHFDIDSDRRAYWTTRKEWRNADWRNAYVYVNGAYWDLTEDLKATMCKNHEVTAEDLRSMVNDAMNRRAYSNDINDYSFEEVSQFRALAVLEDDADMMESWCSVAQTKLESELENIATTTEPTTTEQATATAEATEAEAVTIYATESTETEQAPVVELYEWEKVLVQVEPNTIYDTVTSEPHTYGYRATVCIISEFGNLFIYHGLSTTGKTIKSCKRAANRVLKIRYGLKMSEAVAQGSTLEAMHASFNDETVRERFKAWCADMFANEAEERAAVEAVAPAVLEEYGTSEDAVNAMTYEAYAAMHDGDRRPYQVHEVCKFNRLMKYAAEICEAAATRRQTAGDPLAKYRDLEYLEFDEPRPIYQRHELATA